MRFALAGGNDIFNKDVETALPEATNRNTATVTVPGCHVLPIQEFANKLDALRTFLQDLGMPRIKEMFEVRAAAHNHGFPHCKTLEDFLQAYRTDPYDNKMRALVFYLCNDLWGKGLFIVIEKLIMDKLKLKYSNELVGKKPVKTRHRSGSIKVMLVRMKQTYFIERFRQIGFDLYHEVIYKRNMLVNRNQGVVQVVKVTKESHGYNGYLGLCVGHPSLLDKQTLTPKQPNVSGQNDLLQYIADEAQKGSSMTASDILAAWTKRQPESSFTTNVTTAQPAEVTVTEGSPSFSSVTDMSTESSNVSTSNYLCHPTEQ